ncbi:hypothetical protein CUMW_068220, partial [Citrus unshiu]
PTFQSNKSLIFKSLLTISFALILCSGDSTVHSIAKLKTNDIHCSFATKCMSSRLSKFASTTSIIEMGSQSLTQCFNVISPLKISSVGFFPEKVSINIIPKL